MILKGNKDNKKILVKVKKKPKIFVIIFLAIIIGMGANESLNTTITR